MPPFKLVPIRTIDSKVEISWFDDLCGGDTQFLGTIDPSRRSNYQHCSNIVREAEAQGFQNILLPTSYVVGQEVLPFASAVAPSLDKISLLAAIRTGEIHPPMLARHLATLDHILKGRLTVNIINSPLPGLQESPQLRYQRCAEVIEILKQAWTQNEIDFQGEIYQFKMRADAVKPYQHNGGPLLYFGGISPESQELCAKYCDVFLMWPENEKSIYSTMQQMSAKAAVYNRTIDFGLRVHVIVRDTEQEAKDYTKYLMSKFDEETAQQLKHRTQDSKSAGVLRQDELRKSADADDFIEPFLWTGIGRARSGCAGAIVGTPDQVIEKLNRYMDMGVRSFILSGYPLIEECKLFGEKVLPHFDNIKLAQLQGRIPTKTPETPLTFGKLKA